MRWTIEICLICMTSLVGVLGEVEMARADEKISEKERDFFEKKIRPVLVTHCYECHSAEAVTRGKLKGMLTVDTREGLRKGGDSGAALLMEPQMIMAMKRLRAKSTFTTCMRRCCTCLASITNN